MLKDKVDILSETPFFIQETTKKMTFFGIFSTHVRFFDNYVRSRVRMDSKLLYTCS